MSGAPRGALHSRLAVVESPSMKPFAVRRRPVRRARARLPACARRGEPGLRPACAGDPAGPRARRSRISRPGRPTRQGSRRCRAGSSCKRMPDDPELTLAAVGWDAHSEDSRALVVAIVDEAAATVVACSGRRSTRTTTTRCNGAAAGHRALRARAGRARLRRRCLRDDAGCGDGGLGPPRTLYVRDGKTLRPVLAGTRHERVPLPARQPAALRGRPGESRETHHRELTPSPSAWAQPARAAGATCCSRSSPSRSDHEPRASRCTCACPTTASAYDAERLRQAAHDAWRQLRRAHHESLPRPMDEQTAPTR